MKASSRGLFYWVEQILIFLAHILLLGWILYVLYEGGTLTISALMLHFTGIGIYGGLLIRISSYLAKRRYLRENKNGHTPQSTR